MEPGDLTTGVLPSDLIAVGLTGFPKDWDPGLEPSLLSGVRLSKANSEAVDIAVEWLDGGAGTRYPVGMSVLEVKPAVPVTEGWYALEFRPPECSWVFIQENVTAEGASLSRFRVGSAPSIPSIHFGAEEVPSDLETGPKYVTTGATIVGVDFSELVLVGTTSELEAAVSLRNGDGFCALMEDSWTVVGGIAFRCPSFNPGARTLFDLHGALRSEADVPLRLPDGRYGGILEIGPSDWVRTSETGGHWKAAALP